MGGGGGGSRVFDPGLKLEGGGDSNFGCCAGEQVEALLQMLILTLNYSLHNFF